MCQFEDLWVEELVVKAQEVVATVAVMGEVTGIFLEVMGERIGITQFFDDGYGGEEYRAFGNGNYGKGGGGRAGFWRASGNRSCSFGVDFREGRNVKAPGNRSGSLGRDIGGNSRASGYRSGPFGGDFCRG
jgi:hypothetical protein